MKSIVGILAAIVNRWCEGVLDRLRIEAAIRYVDGVKKARQGFIALLGTFLLALLMMSGFLLIHVALFVWLPWSVPVKALILLILGVVYLGIGLAFVLKITSNRAWMEFTGVDEVLDRSLFPHRRR
jgi:hypothetical protein